MLTIRKTTLSLLLLAIGCLSGLLMVSCNNDTGKEKEKNRITIEIPADNSGLDKIDHFIPEDSIKLYRSAFERQRERIGSVQVHVPTAEAFNKRAVLSLLKANDCVGIRIYYGAKAATNGNGRSELRLILVGVDSKGNDILIDQSSALAAKITGTMGGEEHGQCPDCQN